MKTQEMKTQHTPGKWSFSTTPQPNGCPIVGNDRGLMVAMLAHSVNHPDQKKEALANAALIASAPALYGALKVAEDALRAFVRSSGDEGAKEALDKIAAALASATPQATEN